MPKLEEALVLAADYYSDANTTLMSMGDPHDDPQQGDLLSEDQYFMVLKCNLAFRMLICVGGILGNIVNIRTFLRIGLEDSVTIAFFSLAVSDLFLLFIALADAATKTCMIVERDLNVFFEFPLFYVSVFCTVSGRIFADVTILVTTFLAVQRCLCVVIPLHFKGMFTRMRTFIIMAVVWAYCLTCGSVHFAQLEITKTVGHSTNSSTFTMIFKSGYVNFVTYLRIGNALVMNISCQVAIMICISIMGQALRKSAKFRRTASNPGHVTHQNDYGGQGKTLSKEDDAASKKAISNEKERQVMVQVYIVSTVFIITNTPQIITSIIELVIPELGPFQKYHYTFSSYYDIKMAIELINSAVNFFIYYKYNTKFRQMCFKKKKLVVKE